MLDEFTARALIDYSRLFLFGHQRQRQQRARRAHRAAEQTTDCSNMSDDLTSRAADHYHFELPAARCPLPDPSSPKSSHKSHLFHHEATTADVQLENIRDYRQPAAVRAAAANCPDTRQVRPGRARPQVTWPKRGPGKRGARQTNYLTSCSLESSRDLTRINSAAEADF